MLRFLGYLIVLAVATAAAVWLADHPGDVAIRWQGYAIGTSVAALVVGVALIAAVWAVVYHFWRWLRAGPHRLAARQAARRRERGYKALTEGLVAVAAGDARSAQRLGRESGRLTDNPFNLLLLAQAAQLNGDGGAARRHFGAMLEHPETEFLGLRGLLVQSTKAGDWDAALDYARRAHALRPEAEWPSSALFDLEVRAGDWRAAQKVLESAARHKHVSPAEAPRRRAVLLAARARAARARGRDDEALALAREAHRLAPGLTAPAALAAELLCTAGKRRAAAKLIEGAWAAAPHPALATAYAATAPDEAPMQRLKRIERLAAHRPDHPEGHLAVAEAALAAGVWGNARRRLEAATEARPSQRVFRLLAELEERENGDTAAAHDWLLRAASAPPAAAWVCDKCGAVNGEWEARCGSCDDFDSLEWKVPPAPASLAPTLDSEPHPASADEARRPGAVVVDATLARE